VRFFCIGDEDTVAGFRLAGCEARPATTAEEARTALAEATLGHDCGIIIITERMADAVRDEIEAIRFGRERPLIVEVPGPEGAVSGRKDLREVVQEAVGMRIS
jgi:V/A-type H+/Na+-transporting ATPase subunit F